MTTDKIVILGAKRTAMGGMMGDLTNFSASALGSAAIKAAIDESGVDIQDVDEALMGNVLQAGQGQAPARQAVLGAGLPDSIPCTTVNKMCGSGMRAVMDAVNRLAVEEADVMIAGGMESMSNAPYLLQKARGGYRLGHGDLKDHMMLDGLEDSFTENAGQPMGSFADSTAQHYQFSREAQDAYAIESLKRAQKAIEDGSFDNEVTTVSYTRRGKTVEISKDEQPHKARIDKIPSLRPAFVKDGTVTAANSSSISDGAAALVLCREQTAQEKGLKPIARIIAQADHAQEPAWFTTAPVGAIKKVLKKADWSISDVDLFEINEAFACVTMVAMQDLGLDHSKVNIHGGACALGHPIGASGARIMVTLINALRKEGKKRGIAALCIGGGEATAMAIELQ